MTDEPIWRGMRHAVRMYFEPLGWLAPSALEDADARRHELRRSSDRSARAVAIAASVLAVFTVITTMYQSSRVQDFRELRNADPFKFAIHVPFDQQLARRELITVQGDIATVDVTLAAAISTTRSTVADAVNSSQLSLVPATKCSMNLLWQIGTPVEVRDDGTFNTAIRVPIDARPCQFTLLLATRGSITYNSAVSELPNTARSGLVTIR